MHLLVESELLPVLQVPSAGAPASILCIVFPPRYRRGDRRHGNFTQKSHEVACAQSNVSESPCPWAVPSRTPWSGAHTQCDVLGDHKLPQGSFHVLATRALWSNVSERKVLFGCRSGSSVPLCRGLATVRVFRLSVEAVLGGALIFQHSSLVSHNREYLNRGSSRLSDRFSTELR